MVDLNKEELKRLQCERTIIDQIGLVAFIAGYPGNVDTALKEKRPKRSTFLGHDDEGLAMFDTVVNAAHQH